MLRTRIAILFALGLTACAGPLKQFNFSAAELHRAPNFTHENLESRKVAVLAASGIEGYRKVVGDSFAKALRETHPDIPLIPPQQVLSLLNHADMADEYTGMLKDYETSGILRKSGLKRIGEALGARYLVQLNLLQYAQDTSTRFSVLGIRFLQTRSSTLRVFAQIWDSESGEIVWEGSSAVTLAGEDVREKPIPFEDVAARAWTALIRQMP